MNITFLIGNGFDLNLGLKTQYNDFLKAYIATASPEKVIEQFKTVLVQDLPFWSSAEEAFGDYTKEFSSTAIGVESFSACHMDFCVELAQYLEKQEGLLHFELLESVLPPLFMTSIQNIKLGFREEQAQQISSCIGCVGGGFNYNFITFNYTRLLDSCVRISNQESVLGTREHHGQRFQNSFGSLIHVHGFTDRDMVLGVNDESQIRNLDLFANQPEEYLGQIIKRQTNRLNEEHIDQKCTELLNKSDLIYIYGMSIGKTDAIWWQRICEAMKKKDYVRTIIHAFDAPPDQLIRTKYLRFEKTAKKNFTDYCDFSEDTKDLIMQRIHITNSNLFYRIKDLVNHKANLPPIVTPVSV